MKTFITNNQLRKSVREQRLAGKTIAFVPTMGNLHEGHLQLVRKARQLADIVVVSIFVNPMQFGANEDLAGYPRTLAEDKKKLFSEGAQFLFYPGVDEIYPDGPDKQCRVSVPDLSDTLCGANRPGHFTGVATVVAKLFNIVQPDIAVFGKKDFQQLTIIERMVEDLCMPIDVIGIETARDVDGLALSSRNGYLNARERRIAPFIHETLQELRDAVACGFDSYIDLEKHAREKLKNVGFEPDYVSVLDARTLKEVNDYTEQIVILAAARLGKTRLIDNVCLTLNPTQDWGMLATH